MFNYPVLNISNRSEEFLNKLIDEKPGYSWFGDFEIIKDFEKLLNHLQNISKDNNRVRKTSQTILHFFQSFKHDYFELLSVKKSESYTKLERKSYSMQSITNLNMEKQNEFYNDGKKCWLTSIDDSWIYDDDYDYQIKSLNDDIKNLRLEPKNYEDQAVQVRLLTDDKSIETVCDDIFRLGSGISTNLIEWVDVLPKYLFLRGQTREIYELIDGLEIKHDLMKEKCHKAVDMLTLIKKHYGNDFEKVFSVCKSDVNVNTCDSWLRRLPGWIKTNRRLEYIKKKLRLAHQIKEEREQEITQLLIEQDEQFSKIDQLTGSSLNLFRDQEALALQFSEVKQSNLHMDVERQKVLNQIDLMEEDWSAIVKSIYQDRVPTLRSDYRKQITNLKLNRLELLTKFQDDEIRTSDHMLAIEPCNAREIKFRKDIDDYMVLTGDIEHLKNRITELQQEQEGFPAEKEQLAKEESLMVSQVTEKNNSLSNDIEDLKGVVNQMETENEQIRTTLAKYFSCFEELRTISMNQENHDSEKFVHCFRSIISKYDKLLNIE